MRIIVLIVFMPFYLNAQVIDARSVDVSFTIPSIAIIDLAPDKSTINLKVEAPERAGDPIDMTDAVNDEKWINYSSSLRSGEPYRNITAQIISGELPNGIQLKLKAGGYTGNGKGHTGKSNNDIILSNVPQILVRDIGAAVTGRGRFNGHQLFFSLDYAKYGDIDFGKEAIVIVFTLTDN